MFYDQFAKLCLEKGVSRTRACIDCGVSRTAWHKWETGSIPNGATINKIASYFGVHANDLLGVPTPEEPKNQEAPTPKGERTVTDDAIKFALFGGDGDITDAMYEEVKLFAQMVKLREDAKKKG